MERSNANDIRQMIEEMRQMSKERGPVVAEEEDDGIDISNVHWLDAYRVPKRFRGKTFGALKADSDKESRIHKFCEAWARNFNDALKNGGNLVFSGNVGSGKTHIAISILLYVVAQKHSALYTTIPQMLAEVRDTYSDSKITPGQVINEYITPELLVLDEAGARKESENDKEILFRVINKRYENMLPTIVITNLGMPDLREAIGDRTVDRLKEGGGRAFAFDWESKRGKIV